MRATMRKKKPMARICKSKGCNNEIPEDWKVPYCDACRYRMAKKVKDGLAAVGATIVSVGSVVLLVGKDKVVDTAKAVLRR